MDTEQISSSLDQYLREKNNYAILINGSWGSGKTKFIKDYIKDKTGYIYTSLYGVDSTDQITDNIISNIANIEGLSNQNIETSEKILGATLGISTNNDNSSNLAFIAGACVSVFKNRFLKKLDEKYIIIFDDYERSNISDAKAFSIINHFSQNQGSKCIIICNENEIKSPKEYELEKEKTVFNTYTLNLSNKEKAKIAFSDILLENQDFLDYSQKQLERSLPLLNCENLRTLKFSAYIFQKIILSLHEHDTQYDLQLCKLIEPCLLFSYAHKEICINSDTMKKIVYQPFNMVKEIEKEGKDSNLNVFFKKMKNLGLNDLKLPSIYKMVYLGLTDKDELNSDISRLSYKRHGIIRTLSGDHENSNDLEYEKKVHDFIQDIKNQKIEIRDGNQLITIIQTLFNSYKKGAFSYEENKLKEILSNWVDKTLSERNYNTPKINYEPAVNTEKFLLETFIQIKFSIESHIRENDEKNLDFS